MKKLLQISLFCMLYALVGSASAYAQEVTLDFTTNGWGLPEGSTKKLTDTKSYTKNDTTITLTGTSGGGYYFNTEGYLLFGKSGATLALPAFDFAVEKIEVVGRTGASAKTGQNIYVGETAVSTATTGATGTNTYNIASKYQAAGNVYVLKVTSNHNSQVTKINIYKKSGTSKKAASLAFSETKIDIESGVDEFKAPTFTKATTADVTFTSDNESVATVSSDGVIALAGGIGTAVITATAAENNDYNAETATCTINVYKYNVYKKVTTITSGKEYLIAAQRNDSTMYAYPLSKTYTYGYMSAGVVKEKTDEIKVKSLYDDAFTITAVDGGYTIQDCYDRYLYQSGKYNSFNVATDKAYTWSVEAQSDGTFKISMNNYFIQWGQTTYKTFGVYTDLQDKAVMPMLYQLDESASSIDPASTIRTQALDENGAIYNLAGQRVSSSYKGVVIKNGKKYIKR